MNTFRYKVTILLLTFISYTCYHLSRKAISVVKPVLIECPDDNNTADVNHLTTPNDTCSSYISKSLSILKHMRTELLTYRFLTFKRLDGFCNGCQITQLQIKAMYVSVHGHEKKMFF